jgi:hypothetical protein
VDIWGAGIVAIEMAEGTKKKISKISKNFFPKGQPPHWDLDPMEAIFVISKSPPPKLKEAIWTPEFKNVLEVETF